MAELAIGYVVCAGAVIGTAIWRFGLSRPVGAVETCVLVGAVLVLLAAWPATLLLLIQDWNNVPMRGPNAD